MTTQPAMAHRTQLAWRTARQLRPGQITNRIWRALWRPAAVTGVPLDLRTAPHAWADTPRHPGEWLDSTSVRILGETGIVREAADWRRAFDADLRLYHLHYLDQLCASEQPAEGFPAALLARWATDNPPGSRPGWDPYPTSRRLVNALKAALGAMPLTQAASASLADQCRYLAPRVELHLLGNHLLANAKALMFAGACLRGVEAEGWLQRGRRLLAREVPEQVLADGGHIERSPMYHAIVTQDLLDLVNLRNCYALAGLEYLDDACGKMLGWYASVRHPDGGITLINDSVQDVAPPFATLAAYAQRLGLPAPPAPRSGLTLLRASGYARLAIGPWCLLADVGSVGPAYQPGHAHAGTLSYELSMGTDRIVVDTGVSTYAADEVREHERSTAAHNTVTLDALNSSEVWGAFRVAGRAKVTALGGGETAPGCWVKATHDGYARSRYRALHTRRWQVCADAVEIEDTVRGSGAPATETAVHFHPHCVVRAPDHYHVAVAAPSGAHLLLTLDEALEWRHESYLYAPAFGVRVPATVVRGSTSKPLPRALRTRFEVSTHRRS
jgi:uncharacterized heparinase superfamily protein